MLKIEGDWVKFQPKCCLLKLSAVFSFAFYFIYGDSMFYNIQHSTLLIGKVKNFPKSSLDLNHMRKEVLK